jgi:hypothetical protein
VRNAERVAGEAPAGDIGNPFLLLRDGDLREATAWSLAAVTGEAARTALRC